MINPRQQAWLEEQVKKMQAMAEKVNYNFDKFEDETGEIYSFANKIVNGAYKKDFGNEAEEAVMAMVKYIDRKYLIQKKKGEMMAKIFRFSGYYVEINNLESVEKFKDRMFKLLGAYECDIIQQLHIEESKEIDLDGEEEEDCDLALLARHFKRTEGTTEFGRPFPQKGEVYRHFKAGKCATVIGVSRHTETEEVTVVYEHEGTIWNRPLAMFMSEVDKEKYPDTTQKYRFEKVETIGDSKTVNNKR